MLFDPSAMILADRGQRRLFASALPDAPVVEPRVRRSGAARSWLRVPGHVRPGRATARLAG